jgi:hypothetical protein
MNNNNNNDTFCSSAFFDDLMLNLCMDELTTESHTNDDVVHDVRESQQSSQQNLNNKNKMSTNTKESNRQSKGFLEKNSHNENDETATVGVQLNEKFTQQAQSDCSTLKTETALQTTKSTGINVDASFDSLVNLRPSSIVSSLASGRSPISLITANSIKLSTIGKPSTTLVPLGLLNSMKPGNEVPSSIAKSSSITSTSPKLIPVSLLKATQQQVHTLSLAKNDQQNHSLSPIKSKLDEADLKPLVDKPSKNAVIYKVESNDLNKHKYDSTSLEVLINVPLGTKNLVSQDASVSESLEADENSNKSIPYSVKPASPFLSLPSFSQSNIKLTPETQLSANSKLSTSEFCREAKTEIVDSNPSSIESSSLLRMPPVYSPESFISMAFGFNRATLPNERNSAHMSYESCLKALLHNYPIFLAENNFNKPASIALPYLCASSLNEFYSWPYGKRKAIEWMRAVHLRRKCELILLNDAKSEHLDNKKQLWSTKRIVLWLRAHGFTPIERQHLTNVACKNEDNSGYVNSNVSYKQLVNANCTKSIEINELLELTNSYRLPIEDHHAENSDFEELDVLNVQDMLKKKNKSNESKSKLIQNDQDLESNVINKIEMCEGSLYVQELLRDMVSIYIYFNYFISYIIIF